MYIALVDGYPTLASKSLDPKREYCCTTCHERVALKTGLYVAPHFAHYPRSDCPRRGGGEGKEHASLKVQLYNLLWPEAQTGRIFNLRMEAPFGEMVSDLGFTTPQGRYVAVEITVNNLNFAHTKEKIRAYRQMKVYPLWLFAHSVLNPRSRHPLTSEKITAAMQAEAADWVKLEGLYRPPRVMVYPHSFLGHAFLLLPNGMPVVIRLVKPEGGQKRKRQYRKVLVLPRGCYPLTLDLLHCQFEAPSFFRPIVTPMAALSPQLVNLLGASDGGNLNRRTIIVSERTNICFNFRVVKNECSEGTYNA